MAQPRINLTYSSLDHEDWRPQLHLDPRYQQPEPDWDSLDWIERLDSDERAALHARAARENLDEMYLDDPNDPYRT